MSVMISGQRPGEELNGLNDLGEHLMEADAEDVVVIAVMRVTKIVDNVEKGERHPVVRLARVEPVLEESAKGTAAQLMQGAYEARTGNEALDLADIEGEGE